MHIFIQRGKLELGNGLQKHSEICSLFVATHSPLICRACENGSIWRLAAPGSNQQTGEITGEDKDKLIYGDILDAYETDVFGAKITRGEEGKEKQEIYRNLVYKENYGVELVPPRSKNN